MAERRNSEDLLTAQDIVAQYGINPIVVESLMRNLGKRGLIENIEGFRRDFVRRKHTSSRSRRAANRDRVSARLPARLPLDAP